MGSAWTTEDPKPPSAEFDEFLDLYRAFASGKTASPDKLRFRLKKIWDAFPPAKKKDFTDRMVAIKALPPEVEEIVRIFNGTIADFGKVV